MDALLLMLANRPSTLANLFAFAVLATAERGALRALLWLATGTTLAWLSEASSIRTGFPYGFYFYHSDAFVGEPSLGGVPLFASVSISCLTYFGYSAARALLGAPFDSARVLWLAALLVTWLDVVMDPVTLAGRHWYLGDLYHYAADGLHFGVPLSNYAGWFLTAAAIMFVNQRLAAALEGVAPAGGFALPFRDLLGVTSQLGTYVYMLGAATYLAFLAEVPSDFPATGIFATTVICSAAYAVFILAVANRYGSAEAFSAAASTLRRRLFGSIAG
ncbi:MAG: carotenoid biosynthesis protein [Candidatus Binatia bacterium]